MKKNYFAFFAMLLCGAAFAQTEKGSTELPSQVTRTTATAQPITQVVSKDNNAPVFEKTPLPAVQKVSPAVFYIINDQPVDEQTYKRSLQSVSTNK